MNRQSNEVRQLRRKKEKNEMQTAFKEIQQAFDFVFMMGFIEGLILGLFVAFIVYIKYAD